MIDHIEDFDIIRDGPPRRPTRTQGAAPGQPPERPCLLDAFFRSEQERHPGRPVVAMISCPCPKCSPVCL